MVNATEKTGNDNMQQGVSRGLTLSRVLHFESLMRRRLGEARTQRYVRLMNYYMNQQLPPENVDQPLMINHFARICDKHNGYLWGEYNKHVVDFRVTIINKEALDPGQQLGAEKIGRQIKALLERVIFTENNGDVTLDDASLNGSIYGDSVFELGYNQAERRVTIESVLPEYFHCMWQISNMQKLTEVIVAYPIDRMVALDEYGTNGNDQFLGYQMLNPDYTPGIGVLWKRWSPVAFQVWVDDVNVINQPNPYVQEDPQGNIYPGMIPFIHIPNLRAGSEFFGYGDSECCINLFDELNRRMADFGDIINSHAHPIITLKAFTGEQEDLPVGPDSIWDLGKDGEATRMDGTGPGPEAMGYLDKVKSEIQETGAMPAIAYGGHSGGGGGSHVSGVALAMAMMPVVERSRKKRLRWKAALKRMAEMILYIISVNDPALLQSYGFSYEQTLLFQIEPLFSQILPKDELQMVNENVALASNMLRSTELALEKQGCDDIPAEIAKIKADMQFKAALAAPTPPAEGGTAGQNDDQGKGGSNALPGGLGSEAGKPGVLISSPTLDKVDNVSMANAPG
jgi:hypothetical protein